MLCKVSTYLVSYFTVEDLRSQIGSHPVQNVDGQHVTPVTRVPLDMHRTRKAPFKNTVVISVQQGKPSSHASGPYFRLYVHKGYTPKIFSYILSP